MCYTKTLRFCTWGGQSHGFFVRQKGLGFRRLPQREPAPKADVGPIGGRVRALRG